MALPTSGPISLNDIRDEFRAGHTGAHSITDYYRGGDHVPNEILGQSEQFTIDVVNGLSSPAQIHSDLFIDLRGNSQPENIVPQISFAFPSETTLFTAGATRPFGGGQFTFCLNDAGDAQTIVINADSLSLTDGAVSTTEFLDAIVSNIGNLSGVTNWTAERSGNSMTWTSTVASDRTASMAAMSRTTGTFLATALTGTTGDAADNLTITSTVLPADTTYAAFDTGDTESAEAGGITVSVTDDGTYTADGPLSTQSVGTSTTVGSWYTSGSGPDRNGFQQITIDASTAFARLQYTRAATSHTSEIRDHNNNVIYTGTDTSLVVRGPAWVEGDAGLGLDAATVEAATQVQAGARFSLAWTGNAPSRGGTTTGRGTRSDVDTTRQSISFTNTNDYIVALNANSTGGARTIDPGATVDVQDGDTDNETYRIASDGGTQNILAQDSGDQTGASHTVGGVTVTRTTGGTGFVGPLGSLDERAGGTVTGAPSENPIAQADYTVVASDSVIRLNTAGTVTYRDAVADPPFGNAVQRWWQGPAYQAGDESGFENLGTSLGTADEGTRLNFFASNNAGLSATALIHSARRSSAQLYNFGVNNTNDYPITFNADSSLGGESIDTMQIAANTDSTDFVEDATSLTYRFAWDQQALNLSATRWSVTNNRPESLQQDLFNFTIVAGGETIPVGSVARGDTETADTAGGNTATTGTWSANIFETNTVNFNQSTAGTSTTIGSVTINRTDTTIGSTQNTGTGDVANVGGINVTTAAGDEVFTGDLGAGSTLASGSNPSGAGSSVTTTYEVTAADAVIVISSFSSAPGPGDDTTTGGAYTITSSGYNPGSIANGQGRHLRGPAYVSGDSSHLTFHGTVAVGTLTVTSGGVDRGGGTVSNSVNVRRRAGVATTDITYTNNNPYDVELSSGTTGTTGTTLTASGGTFTAENQENANWTVASANINATGSGAGYAGGWSVDHTDATTSVNATYSGGRNNAQRSGAGPDGAALSITFPANTEVDQTFSLSWSVTDVTYSLPSRSQDDQPYGWGLVTGNIEFSFGGYSFSTSAPVGIGDSGGGNSGNVPGPHFSGAWGLPWYVSAGGGLQCSGTGTANVNFAGQSHQSNFNGIGAFYNLQPGAASRQPMGGPPDSTTGANNSGSGSLRIHGTTGDDGCTIRLAFSNPINDSRTDGWFPTTLGTFTGTASADTITFTNNNNQAVTLAADSTGDGGSVASGAVYNAQEADDMSDNDEWVISLGSVTGYNYTAQVAANRGSATVTHAGGDIPDVELTTTAQAIASFQTSDTINVQGSYTTVSGTSEDVGTITATNPVEGNVFSPSCVTIAVTGTELNRTITLDPGLTTPTALRDNLQQQLGTVPGFTITADDGYEYPSTGGIALESLGSTTHGASATDSWPTALAEVLGESTGITYTSTSGLACQITNGTGSDIDITNARLDVDINFTEIPTSGTMPDLRMTAVDPGTGTTTTIFNESENVTATGRVTFSGSLTTVTTWENGEHLFLRLDETDAAERPFTYTVERVRLSYSATPFGTAHPQLHLQADETTINHTIMISLVDGDGNIVADSSAGVIPNSETTTETAVLTFTYDSAISPSETVIILGEADNSSEIATAIQGAINEHDQLGATVVGRTVTVTDSMRRNVGEVTVSVNADNDAGIDDSHFEYAETVAGIDDVPINQTVPTSGEISFSNFYGTRDDNTRRDG